MQVLPGVVDIEDLDHFVHFVHPPRHKARALPDPWPAITHEHDPGGLLPFTPHGVHAHAQASRRRSRLGLFGRARNCDGSCGGSRNQYRRPGRRNPPVQPADTGTPRGGCAPPCKRAGRRSFGLFFPDVTRRRPEHLAAWPGCKLHLGLCGRAGPRRRRHGAQVRLTVPAGPCFGGRRVTFWA